MKYIGDEELKDYDYKAFLTRVLVAVDDAGGDIYTPAPTSWHAALSLEFFEGFQMVWAAMGFDFRKTAAYLSEEKAEILPGWCRALVSSVEYKAWAAATDNKVQLSALVNLSMKRSAEILSRSSNDPKVMSVQTSLVKTVMSAAEKQADVERRNADLEIPTPAMEEVTEAEEPAMLPEKTAEVVAPNRPVLEAIDGE